MKRPQLWMSKYNLPLAAAWAIAALGLAALLFLLYAAPAYLRLMIRLSPASGSDLLPTNPVPLHSVWRTLAVSIYLLLVGFIMLSPIAVTLPPRVTHSQDIACKTGDFTILKKERLRRQTLISTMAAGTIQKIRSPLTAARGFVQLMGALPPESEHAQEYIQYALLEMDRVEQLMQEYMLLSEATMPKSLPVNLLPILHKSCQMMAAIMQERSIELKLESTQSAFILGDQFYLNLIMQHLLLNAADATQPAGSITVCLQTSDTSAVISVSDTGLGMSQNELEHCFDPFYSNKDFGTGLGLSICQRMVMEMKGQIQVFSEPKIGTTFKLTFPLYNKPEGVRSP